MIQLNLTLATLMLLFAFSSEASETGQGLELEQIYKEISTAQFKNSNVIAFWDLSIKDVVGRDANNSKRVLEDTFKTTSENLDRIAMLLKEKHQIEIQSFPARVILQKGSKQLTTIEAAEKKILDSCREQFNDCFVHYSNAEEAPFDSRGQILGLPYYKLAFINVIGIRK
ncbi:MAG: hypothetical protein VX642_13585 [Bdellovibrionota bacterium]|nr:hypothetical protein [Bdellovibrionota bacterium]